MFTITITTYVSHLTNLRAIIEKAKIWQESQNIKDETIMTARLSLDQFTFAQQVRSATNFARQAAGALCNLDLPKYEDTEATLSDLQSRIDTTLLFLSTVTEDSVTDDLETRLIPLYWMPGKGLTAKYFVKKYSLSNFFFHYTTAYSILRHHGLAIGKADYMGSVELQDLAH